MTNSPVYHDLGLLGTDHITNTSANSLATGWGKVFAIADAAAVLEGPALTLNGSTAVSISLTIPKGETIYGKFTKITLSSGSVLAYRL